MVIGRNIVIFLLCLTVVSCQRLSGPLAVGRGVVSDRLTEEEARAYLCGSDVMMASFPVIAEDEVEGNSVGDKYFLNPGNYVPDWSRCQIEHCPDCDVLYVSIWPTHFHAAMDTSVQVRRKVPVVQRLKVIRNNANRDMSLLYESVIPAESYYRSHRLHQGTGYINKRRGIFSATVVEQDTSGRVTHILRYECGVLTDTLYALHCQDGPYKFLRNFIWQSAHCVITRSGNESEELFCAICGLPIDDCICEEPGITYCAHCLFPIDDCHCCRVCGRYPCNCNNAHDTEDGGNDGDHAQTGGNTSGTNGMGHQLTVARISLAAVYAVDKVIELYGMTQAECNLGVQLAFQYLFETNPMADMLANQMISYWGLSSDWTELTMLQAYQYANAGWFVVAGWPNTMGGSGHVAVIVPGNMQYSASWQMNVPMSMDTGEDNRWSNDKLSRGFASSKKDQIKYYKYE